MMGVAQQPSPGQRGDVLQTVLVGYPIAGILALWHDDGNVSYCRAREPDALTDHLGAGAIARSEVAPRRFREAGLFNPRTNVLLLPARHSELEHLAAATVELTAVESDEAHESVSRSDPASFYLRLGPIAVEAARRGEFVAVETGGWEIPFSPFALLMAVREPDGSWSSLVETEPVPKGVPIWSAKPHAEEAAGQTLSWPASVDAITVASKLAALAIEAWGIPLLDLGLSFGPSPFGPWPG
jgi:hypothetical protein